MLKSINEYNNIYTRYTIHCCSCIEYVRAGPHGIARNVCKYAVLLKATPVESLVERDRTDKLQ
jgi:hypothetical protein